MGRGVGRAEISVLSGSGISPLSGSGIAFVLQRGGATEALVRAALPGSP